jgi:uncharacterized cupin superfamily protein
VNTYNILGEDWDGTHDRPGFRSRATAIGDRLGGELIGGTLYELDPGEKTWPYHLHHANEEWLLVVQGSPTLRGPEGEHELAEGDVVCFPRGPEGAHQVLNRSAATARFLILSTKIAPEFVEYPDSGKIGARDARGERAFIVQSGPQLDYWDGEE